jgi:hypothetical protein
VADENLIMTVKVVELTIGQATTKGSRAEAGIPLSCRAMDLIKNCRTLIKTGEHLHLHTRCNRYVEASSTPCMLSDEDVDDPQHYVACLHGEV